MTARCVRPNTLQYQLPRGDVGGPRPDAPHHRHQKGDGEQDEEEVQVDLARNQQRESAQNVAYQRALC
jgi:hypothetical protein